MNRRSTGAVVVAAAVILILGALFSAACGDAVPDDAVAVVGDVPITKADFDQYMEQAKATVISQSGSFPAAGSAEYDEYTASLVDYLVQSEVVAQGAERLGVEVTALDVSLYIAE
ncbi:MAG TPA: SurA N-terminal domain-containing protein, partial [Thermoleophilia bacterium]|nr:SurA N-terminal domain-containing protein [Thermoleophilia bacterium]